MKLKRVRLVTILIIIILLIVAFNKAWTISKELNGVIIKLDNPDYVEKVTLAFDGQYSLNCFVKDTFTGNLYISNDEETRHPLEDALEINVDEGSPVFYDRGEENVPEVGYGKLLSGTFLLKPCVLLLMKSDRWSTDSGYCLVTSANTHEEALAVLAQYDYFDYLDM